MYILYGTSNVSVGQVEKHNRPNTLFLMYDTGHKTTNLEKRFILKTALLMNVNRKNRYLNDKYSLTFVYNIYNCMR